MQSFIQLKLTSEDIMASELRLANGVFMQLSFRRIQLQRRAQVPASSIDRPKPSPALHRSIGTSRRR